MTNEMENIIKAKELIKTETTRCDYPEMNELEDAIAATVCNLYDITICKISASWYVHWDSSEKQKVKECLKRCFVLSLLLNNHDNINHEPDVYFLACLTGLVKKFDQGVKLNINCLPGVDQYYIAD